MKKIGIYFITLLLVLCFMVPSFAEEEHKEMWTDEGYVNYNDIGTFEEVLSSEDLDSLYVGMVAVRNNSEAYRIAMNAVDSNGTDTVNSVESANLLPDGIYVATRTTKLNYREIQTMFTLGENIGAAYNTSVYFMHNFNHDSGNLIIDSGILYAGGVFAIYHSGTINNNGSPWHAGSSPLSISAGDTIYINSKIQNNNIITDVYSNGVKKGTLTTPVSEGAKNIGAAKVKREFNIAGNGTIDNKNTYFSWSSGQSTVTDINNNSNQMNSINSTLQAISFTQPSWAHTHVGKGRTSYSSGGYIYDRAWCRCNNS